MSTSPFGTLAARARPGIVARMAPGPAMMPPLRRNDLRSAGLMRPGASRSAPSTSKTARCETSARMGSWLLMGLLSGLDEAGRLHGREHLAHRLGGAERGGRGRRVLAGSDDVAHPRGVTRLDGEDRARGGE